MKKYLTEPFKIPEANVILLLVLSISILGFVAMDIFFPSLPAITEHFNITQGESQLTITLYLCGFGFSQLIYGPLSDYYGRRPVLLIGFFIYLLGSLILVNEHTAIFLLLARFVQGVGTGASASLCRVILRDKFIGDKMAKAASYVTIGIAFAAAAAPALGGFIQEYFGFRGNFSAMFFVGLIITIFIFLFLPETHSPIRQSIYHPVNWISSYTKILKQNTFMRYTICSGLSLSALLSFAIVNPFLIEQGLGLSASFYGVIALVIASGEIVGTYTNTLFLDNFGRNKMLTIGIFLLLFSGLAFVLGKSFGFFNMWSVAFPSFFIAFAIGITIPNATASAFSSIKDSIGVAGALYGFFQIAIATFVTYVITILNTQTQNELGWLVISIALLSLLLMPRNDRNIEK